MGLEQRIQKDLIIAMKAKDKGLIRALRAIKSAILLLKTDGSAEKITEKKEIQLLQKLIKQRQESYDIYKKEGRDELAVTEKEEIDAIEKYLPEQLDPGEVERRVAGIVEELGANSMKDMGKVMGMAQKQMAGKVDGKTLADMVKRKLQS